VATKSVGMDLLFSIIIYLYCLKVFTKGSWAGSKFTILYLTGAFVGNTEEFLDRKFIDIINNICRLDCGMIGEYSSGYRELIEYMRDYPAG
jgi:hypothetical protein